MQNVVFADPSMVAEVRRSTIEQRKPAASTFCDELALRVQAGASSSTPGTTAPPG